MMSRINSLGINPVPHSLGHPMSFCWAPLIIWDVSTEITPQLMGSWKRIPVYGISTIDPSNSR